MLNRLLDLLKWIWAFVKNHKKKFIALLVTVGLGAGGFYLMKRALLQKLAEVGELGKKMELRRKKEMELARLGPECTETTLTFVVPLRKQLNRLTDVVPITTKLRDVRTRQKLNKSANSPSSKEDDQAELLHLWDELKVNSLARLMCGVYGLTLLNLLLRVQLLVASKRALSQEAVTEETVRQNFMFKSTDFLVSSGVEHLLQLCTAQIRAGTEEWKMGSDASVSKEEILDKLREVRARIETPKTWFLPSVVLQQQQEMENGGELKALMDETYDLLESPHFCTLLASTLDVVFDAFFEELFQGKPFEPVGGRFILAKVIVQIKLVARNILATTSSSNNSKEEEEEEQPMVVLSGSTSHETVVADVNRYMKKLESVPGLEEFSRTILGLSSEGGDELDFLGDSMKEIMPLLQQMGGGGNGGGAGPDLASLLPLLQQGGGGGGN